MWKFNIGNSIGGENCTRPPSAHQAAETASRATSAQTPGPSATWKRVPQRTFGISAATRARTADFRRFPKVCADLIIFAHHFGCFKNAGRIKTRPYHGFRMDPSNFQTKIPWNLGACCKWRTFGVSAATRARTSCPSPRQYRPYLGAPRLERVRPIRSNVQRAFFDTIQQSA